jgi:hypothetical protein
MPMNSKWPLAAVTAVCVSFASIAYCGPEEPANGRSLDRSAIAKIVPGQSTKAEIKSLLGEPWRVVQFNDCGEAMDDQADETWEYRDDGQDGSYRLHVEFDDRGVVHLLARIPDKTLGGKATSAKAVPSTSSRGMSM